MALETTISRMGLAVSTIPQDHPKQALLRSDPSDFVLLTSLPLHSVSPIHYTLYYHTHVYLFILIAYPVYIDWRCSSLPFDSVSLLSP